VLVPVLVEIEIYYLFYTQIVLVAIGSRVGEDITFERFKNWRRVVGVSMGWLH
jgi:hypothetical protein